MASEPGIVFGEALGKKVEAIDHSQPPRIHEDTRRRIVDTAGGASPEDLKILEAGLQEVERVRSDPRFTPEAKQRLEMEAREAAAKAFKEHHQKDIEAELRSLDQLAGRAKAALRNEAPSLPMASTESERGSLMLKQLHEVTKMQRINADLGLLRDMRDIENVRDIFDEAEGTGDPVVMRRVGLAAVQRAEALVRISRTANPGASASPGDATRRIASDLRGRFAAFRKANPTPSETIRTIAEQREIRERDLRRKGERLLRAYGLA